MSVGRINCIVLTGTLSNTRNDLVREFKQLGVIVDERVTSRTDALVAGKRPGKTKISAASRMGCQVISEDDLRGSLISEQTIEPEVEVLEPPKVKPLARQSWMDSLDTERSVKF